ncbi:MAG TPA: haloacid dehalogenase type II [Anaerolineales bacterium]
MKKLIVFDVNETLLDLKALDSKFEQFFGNASVRTSWFGQVLRNSLVATITGRYDDFGKIAGAALDMTAQLQNVALSPEDRTAIMSGIRSLPPHADVLPGLEKLKSAGFRLFTLTNSPPHVVEAQLQSASLTTYFEKSFSVDAIKKFKPDAEVYKMTAKELGVSADQIRLVAAHDWDVAGALLAGCAAAFIARPGHVLNPGMPEPDIVGKDLVEVADKIIATDS